MMRPRHEDLLQDLALTPRDDGTTGQSRIDDRLIQGVCDWVDGSGVLDLIAEGRADNKTTRQPGGAPAAYADARDRIIVVLVVVLLMEGDAPQLIELQRAVTGRLSPEAKRIIGLPVDDKASDDAVYSRMRRAWDRVTDTFDMAPGRLGKTRPTRTEVEAVIAARDPERCARNAERGRRFLNLVLEASVRLTPEEDLAEWKGNVTLDATVARARGRGHRTKVRLPDDSMNSDFDAEYHQNHDGSKTHGFDVHIALTAQNSPYEQPKHPILAIAATLDQPSRRVGANAVACVQSIVERGYPAGDLTIDKGYSGNCKAEDFHLPVMALGYGLISEPKHPRNENPIQFTHNGANYIDGAWYSPSMPEALVWARVHYADKMITEDVFRARCEARRAYLFTRKDGNAFSCPAQGANATIKCVHKDFFEPKHQPRDGSKRPIARNAPEAPLPACLRKVSTSMPEDNPKVAKYAQSLHYGSAEHNDTYRLHRSTMEGWNGFTKDDNHESLGATRNRRRRGMVNHLFVVALSLAVTNMRKIKAFLAAKARGLDTQPPTRAEQRRRDPYVKHRPSGWAPGEAPGLPAA